MGDGTEPAPILDAEQLKLLSQAIGRCHYRKELDQLTIRVWRTYDSPRNAAALEQLKSRIKAQRDVLKRNDPR